MSSIYLCKSCMTYLFISLFVQFGDPWIRTICVLWAFAYLKKKQSHAYLLGLLAMIKCSICSYQCDNWYSSNRKIACHANFSLGRLFLELARGHLMCCPGIALGQVRHTLRGNCSLLHVYLYILYAQLGSHTPHRTCCSCTFSFALPAACPSCVAQPSIYNQRPKALFWNVSNVFCNHLLRRMTKQIWLWKQQSKGRIKHIAMSVIYLCKSCNTYLFISALRAFVSIYSNLRCGTLYSIVVDLYSLQTPPGVSSRRETGPLGGLAIPKIVWYCII